MIEEKQCSYSRFTLQELEAPTRHLSPLIRRIAIEVNLAFFNFHDVCFALLSRQSLQACPCVSGYVCEMKTSNANWGKCVATDGGSGSGSGSGDF